MGMLKTYIPLLLAGAAFEALGAQSCATLPLVTPDGTVFIMR